MAFVSASSAASEFARPRPPLRRAGQETPAGHGARGFLMSAVPARVLRRARKKRTRFPSSAFHEASRSDLFLLCCRFLCSSRLLRSSRLFRGRLGCFRRSFFHGRLCSRLLGSRLRSSGRFFGCRFCSSGRLLCSSRFLSCGRLCSRLLCSGFLRCSCHFRSPVSGKSLTNVIRAKSTPDFRL